MLNQKAIGGYFELELPRESIEKYPRALKYQSARAAFLALLQQMPQINRIWMPYYICDSMLAPIHAAGKELAFYKINERFTIERLIALAPDDLLLYVNYFGVCDENVAEVLRQYNQEQVIIDCSQAFYSGPFECLATIYSPRKFFGVPDGGLLLTRRALSPPAEQDEESIARCAHLLQRLAFAAEEGYESYKAAEASLNDLTPKRMSQLTQRIMAAIDYLSIEKKRTTNFELLQNELGPTNKLKLKFSSAAPLCYPYLPENKQLKNFLIKKRIFVPTYWPDVKARVENLSFEYTTAHEITAIPCDQRYDEDDLYLITNLIKQGAKHEH